MTGGFLFCIKAEGGRECLKILRYITVLSIMKKIAIVFIAYIIRVRKNHENAAVIAKIAVSKTSAPMPSRVAVLNANEGGISGLGE